MTRKIFRSILAASVSILLAALVIIVGVLYGYFTAIQGEQLRSQLHFATQGVISEGNAYLDGISEKNYRLTLVGADGTVICDTEANPGDMDNHGNRKEILDALQNGEGESTRFSTTLLEKTLYFAQRLPDGNVLRISTTQYSVVTLVLGIMQPIILIFILAMIISAFLANRMSKRIVDPLNTLDLDNPLDNNTYDEISPLLSHIEQQNRKINEQIDELKKNQIEFNAVVRNMKEGLVLLGEDGRILSVNKTAEELFETDSDCVGRDFLTVERNHEISVAMSSAIRDGHSVAYITRGGCEYQLNISRIGDEEKYTGIVVLAFDITDKVFSERNRREFTANVSHELKTPLQSITGRAELIQNGLVKEEDIPKFVADIRSEATRLVALIDDIIRLSQLDEKTEMQFERVDLYATAKEVAEELKQLADKRGIEISVNGVSTAVSSVKRLVQELVFNLCENAVKYNKENGKVVISVSENGGKPEIVVEDTGIGIPQEHLGRVFERFYRVDKSHSRETGGTGLGLSIVKHAAEYIGAEVKLESKLGEGTRITVSWSKNE